MAILLKFVVPSCCLVDWHSLQTLQRNEDTLKSYFYAWSGSRIKQLYIETVFEKEQHCSVQRTESKNKTEIFRCTFTLKGTPGVEVPQSENACMMSHKLKWFKYQHIGISYLLKQVIINSVLLHLSFKCYPTMYFLSTVNIYICSLLLKKCQGTSKMNKTLKIEECISSCFWHVNFLPLPGR